MNGNGLSETKEEPDGEDKSNAGGDVVMASVGGAETATSSVSESTPQKPGKTVDHPNYKEKVPPLTGPSPDRVRALLDRTGYKIEVTPHMRKFGGPPPDSSARPVGTELFVGKLARNCFEDELMPLFEPYGKVWEIRVLIDPETGNGRGFGFVTYVQTDACPKAVAALNEKTVMTDTGRKLTLTVTHNQHRIFVGSIPKEKTRQEVLDAFKPELEGLFDAIVHSVGDESGEKFRNRGFCFLEFDTHDHASNALQRIQCGKTNPFKNQIFGDWAQAQAEPDEETMKSVKVLFLNNLSNEQNEEVLSEAFKPYVGFAHLKKSHAYAFAHFDTRDNAEKALTDINGKLVGGSAISATWARPTDRNKSRPGAGVTRGGGRGGEERGGSFRGGGSSFGGGRGGSRGGGGGGSYGGGDRRGGMRGGRGGGRGGGGDRDGYDDRDNSSMPPSHYIPPPPLSMYAPYPYAPPPPGYGPPPHHYHHMAAAAAPPGWPSPYAPVGMPAASPYGAPGVPPPPMRTGRGGSSPDEGTSATNGATNSGGGKQGGRGAGRGGGGYNKRGMGRGGGSGGYNNNASSNNGRGPPASNSAAAQPPPPPQVAAYPGTSPYANPPYGYGAPPGYADYAAHAAAAAAYSAAVQQPYGAYPMMPHPSQQPQPSAGAAASGSHQKRSLGADGQQNYQPAKKRPYPGGAQAYAAYPGFANDDGFQQF